MLSTPPAFILSQDQTLIKSLSLRTNLASFKKFCLFPSLSESLQILLFLGRTFHVLFVSEFSLGQLLVRLEFSGLFYCSVIKVLCSHLNCFISESSFSLSHLYVIVNKFFIFLKTFMFFIFLNLSVAFIQQLLYITSFTRVCQAFFIKFRFRLLIYILIYIQ